MVSSRKLNSVEYKEFRFREALSYVKESVLTKRESYEQKTEALLVPVTDELGFETVDVEYVKEGSNYFLRAYIDKPGGITIDDCETVSRRLSDILDAEDFIPEAYVLEVSSPGLTRPLKKEKDFQRSIGKDVDIHTFKPIDKEKDFTGELAAYDADTVTIISADGEEMVIRRDNIAMIRLAFDF